MKNKLLLTTKFSQCPTDKPQKRNCTNPTITSKLAETKHFTLWSFQRVAYNLFAYSKHAYSFLIMYQ